MFLQGNFIEGNIISPEALCLNQAGTIYGPWAKCGQSNNLISVSLLLLNQFSLTGPFIGFATRGAPKKQTQTLHNLYKLHSKISLSV